MTIIPALPFTLTNGTLADASQVMADFNDVVNSTNANAAHNGPNSDITSIAGLTTPLSMSQGGTGQTAIGLLGQVLTGTGSGAAAWQTGVAGVQDGSNAPAGTVGEYVSNSSGPVALTSNTAGAVGSLTLSAGDWDVWAYIGFTPSVSAQNMIVGVSSSPTSFTGPVTQIGLTTSSLSNTTLPTPLTRVSLGATSTLDMVAQAGFSSGTCTASGTIFARRRR